jgi:nicotinate-nucleotide adenylyltransferase
VRLGLYGGTFDPPHIGHLIVAQDVLAGLGLDRVIFIPAGTPPHKRDRRITPAPVRLRLLHAAIQDDARFEVDAVEINRSGPSWTVETLETLRERHAGDELFLLMGTDQFAEFSTWRDPSRIAALAHITIMQRDGTTVRDADLAAFGARLVTVTRIDISSTDIRRRVAGGESIRYLVPRAVEDMLEQDPIYMHQDPTCAP